MSESPRYERPKTPETGDEFLTDKEKLDIALERSQYNFEQRGIDPLTGLNNRIAFERDLENEIKLYERSQKRESDHFAVMFIDLDNFGAVNKTIGHAEGDKVLRRVAEIFTNTVRSTDVLSRYGGDEFYILLPQTTEEEAVIVGNKILGNLKNDENLAKFNIGASIGVSTPDVSINAENAEKLVHFADAAGREAKIAGKNQVKVYSGEE
jgi:diguanylate cyclase (GGDEF)-like protein